MNRRSLFSLLALPFLMGARGIGAMTKKIANRVSIHDKDVTPGIWISGGYAGRKQHVAIYYHDVGQYSTPVIQLMDESSNAANLAFGLDPDGRPIMQVMDGETPLIVDLVEIARTYAGGRSRAMTIEGQPLHD